MWIKKSEDEAARDSQRERRRLLRNAILSWISLSVLCSLARGHVGGPGQPLRERTLRGWIITVLASFSISGLGVYYSFWRRKTNPSRQPDAVVCPTCGKVKAPDDKHLCECGGTFVDLSGMKWVED